MPLFYLRVPEAAAAPLGQSTENLQFVTYYEHIIRLVYATSYVHMPVQLTLC